MRKSRRIRTLEGDMLALADAVHTLAATLTDLVPRDDGAAIRASHNIDQVQSRTRTIIDRYRKLRFEAW